MKAQMPKLTVNNGDPRAARGESHLAARVQGNRVELTGFAHSAPSYGPALSVFVDEPGGESQMLGNAWLQPGQPASEVAVELARSINHDLAPFTATVQTAEKDAANVVIEPAPALSLEVLDGDAGYRRTSPYAWNLNTTAEGGTLELFGFAHSSETAPSRIAVRARLPDGQVQPLTQVELSPGDSASAVAQRLAERIDALPGWVAEAYARNPTGAMPDVAAQVFVKKVSGPE